MLTFDELSNQYRPKHFRSILPHDPNTTTAHASGPSNECIAPQNPARSADPAAPYTLNRSLINFGTAENDSAQVSWPPLPSSDTLAQAVSQVVMSMDGWEKEAPVDLFRLFIVLVKPPAGLDLDTVPELPDYLDSLWNAVLKVDKNRFRGIASHCFRALHGI